MPIWQTRRRPVFPGRIFLPVLIQRVCDLGQPSPVFDLFQEPRPHEIDAILFGPGLCLKSMGVEHPAGFLCQLLMLHLPAANAAFLVELDWDRMLNPWAKPS
jgi:hypothetical protein